MSSVIIVSDAADTLSGTLVQYFRAQGIPLKWIQPDTLGTLYVSLNEHYFHVEGQQVACIIFRASPDGTFSEGYAYTDRHFCDSEIKAVWLAALRLRSVMAVNRYDAAAWFEGLSWSIWRQTLLREEIPVSHFVFGGVSTVGSQRWYPYAQHGSRLAPGLVTRRVLGCALAPATGVHSSVVVCGSVVAGEPSAAVRGAAKVLQKEGIRLAEIVSDHEGQVLLVDSQPSISDEIIDPVARLIGELCIDHLRRW